ncbi:MAG: phosphoribosylformylglycinamidine synthase subunit PurS, partial [Dehalococcoidales bacterium]|nr:phosphoribosylformylglycinamidine synthase subunit PurS [Dehalococcoidales bacterium]
MHRIEVSLKSDQPDARGAGLVKDIHDLGIRTVTDVRVVDIYWFDVDMTGDLDLIGRKLLADPITQQYSIFSGETVSASTKIRQVEVAYNAGVADPVEETVMKAIRELGVSGVRTV